jgi:hypothetical protein
MKIREGNYLKTVNISAHIALIFQAFDVLFVGKMKARK